MVMPKRLSGSRRVVSLYDPALVNFPQLRTEKLDNGQEVPILGLVPYGATLDMSFLGDLSELPCDGPTVFEVMPLRTRFLHLDKGEKTDWTIIFQLHVSAIDNSGIKNLSWEQLPNFDYKTLTDESLEMFPVDFIRDIGNMIVQLAKGDGATIPFLMLDTYMDVSRRSRAARLLSMSRAATAGAKISD